MRLAPFFACLLMHGCPHLHLQLGYAGEAHTCVAAPPFAPRVYVNRRRVPLRRGQALTLRGPASDSTVVTSVRLSRKAGVACVTATSLLPVKITIDY